MTPDPGFETGLHWWETSSHTTAPSLTPAPQGIITVSNFLQWDATSRHNLHIKTHAIVRDILKINTQANHIKIWPDCSLRVQGTLSTFEINHEPDKNKQPGNTYESPLFWGENFKSGTVISLETQLFLPGFANTHSLDRRKTARESVIKCPFPSKRLSNTTHPPPPIPRPW